MLMHENHSFGGVLVWWGIADSPQVWFIFHMLLIYFQLCFCFILYLVSSCSEKPTTIKTVQHFFRKINLGMKIKQLFSSFKFAA